MHKDFNFLWMHTGSTLLSYLWLDECLRLATVYPFVCDSMFYHAFGLCKRFFKRFWLLLLCHPTDFVKSHDCYELLYQHFAKGLSRVSPSPAMLPMPLEGTYPIEPYLSGRVVGAFRSALDCVLCLSFVCSPHIASILDGVHFEAFNTTVHVTADEDDPRVFLVDHGASNQRMRLDLKTLLALVFEIFMAETSFDMQVFGLEHEPSILLLDDTPYAIDKKLDANGWCLDVCRNAHLM